MFDIVKAFHEAFHTESTWAFVLPVAAMFAIMSGSLAWVIDKGYKKSLLERPSEPIIVRDTAGEDALRQENNRLRQQLDDRQEQQRIAERRRSIQLKIAEFLVEANTVRAGWLDSLNQPPAKQFSNVEITHAWHRKVEDYLKTIPRGTVYAARFNNQIRAAGSYPIGITANIAGHWDLLMSDVARLNEIMNDPDLGRD
jgi:hypothetical protein